MSEILFHLLHVVIYYLESTALRAVEGMEDYGGYAPQSPIPGVWETYAPLKINSCLIYRPRNGARDIK